MVAVPAADIQLVAQGIRHHIGPTAVVVVAADAAVVDNVAGACAHRHWSYGRGCPCGHDHVSWRCGTNDVGSYFRPRQSSDCALKMELGVAMEEPMM